MHTPVLPHRLDLLLHNYDAVQRAFLVDGFTFGFKTSYGGPRNFSRIAKNHTSTHLLPLEVDSIISTELARNQIIGPFSDPPFELFITSPISLVPKKDGSYRFIHDLSHPKRILQSVNSYILPEDATVQYENLDHYVKIIQTCGRNALLSKLDIENAFRIVPMHPSEYPLLGFTWRKQFYINSTLCMGLSTSCVRFEAFSSAIQWAVQQKFPKGSISHILDDFLLAGPAGSTLCQDTLDYLLHICRDIPVKHAKTVLPCTKLTAHGLEIDSTSFLIRLPPDKLDKCRTSIRSILHKRSVTLHVLQQIHGLLNFACRAISPGRPFLRRLCDAMSGVSRPDHYVRGLGSLASIPRYT